MAPTLPRLTPGASLSRKTSEKSSSPKRSSSSVGSNPGPTVLTSSDNDDDLLASSRKRRPPRNQAWCFCDEVNILTALAAERLESGRLPSPSALLDSIRLQGRENPTAGDVAKKVHNLMKKFGDMIESGGPSNKIRDRKIYYLSKKVWPELLLPS